jgi:hypothetical protein
MSWVVTKGPDVVRLDCADARNWVLMCANSRALDMFEIRCHEKAIDYDECVDQDL